MNRWGVRTFGWLAWLTLFCLVSFIRPAIAGPEAVSPASSASIDVADFRGRRLTFAEPVDRIVVLLDSALSGLYMLGVAQQRVVGVSMTAYTGSSAPYFAALDPRMKEKTLPVVSGSTAGSLERIIALKPQVVIIWSLNKELIDALEARGVAVFGVFIQDIADIYTEMLAFGEMTGTARRAHELVDYTRRQVALVHGRTERLPVGQRPRSYFMWAKGHLDSGGSRSIIHDMLGISGSVNICGHVDQEHVVNSLEYLVGADPQLIVMWYNALDDPGDIARQPVWKAMSATKNNRIHEIPDLFHCDLWTLNFQFALKLMAKWTHPDLFRSLDLKQDCQATFYKLYGVDLPDPFAGAL